MAKGYINLYLGVENLKKWKNKPLTVREGINKKLRAYITLVLNDEYNAFDSPLSPII